MIGLIKQEVLADGMRLTLADGRVFQITSNDLPGNIRNGTTQQCEVFCNNFLEKAIRTDGGIGWYAKVHITQNVPLTGLLVTSDTPIPDYVPGQRPWERP